MGVREVVRGMGAVLTTQACVAGSACSVRLSAGSSMKHSTPRLVSAKTCVVEGSRAASSTHAKMAALSESDPCSRDE